MALVLQIKNWMLASSSVGFKGRGLFEAFCYSYLK